MSEVSEVFVSDKATRTFSFVAFLFGLSLFWDFSF